MGVRIPHGPPKRTQLRYFVIKWHSCDSLFCVQFTAQLIAYRLPAFFALLHKCHVLRGCINITVVAFFGGCVLIAEVPKNQKALVGMNSTLPSALVHRPPKVITPTSRYAPRDDWCFAASKNVGADSISARARLRQDKLPRAHIECAPTDYVSDKGRKLRAGRRLCAGALPLQKRRGGFHIRPCPFAARANFRGRI